MWHKNSKINIVTNTIKEYIKKKKDIVIFNIIKDIKFSKKKKVFCMLIVFINRYRKYYIFDFN